jgi:hypothetical protein
MKAASARACTAMLAVPRVCPISTKLRHSAIHAADHLPDSELEP